MPSCLEPAHDRGVCRRHWTAFFGNPDELPTSAVDPEILTAITWGASASPILMYRQRRGWTQAFLAQLWGTTAKTISLWENQGAPPYAIFALYGLEALESAAAEGRLDAVTTRLFERMKSVP